MSEKVVMGRMFPGDSPRVSKILEAAGLPDDPKLPYYPQIAMIATSGGNDVGFLTASIVKNTAFVNSILVVPETRRLGVALQMLANLETRAWAADCYHVAFFLLASFGEELKDGLVEAGYKIWKEEHGTVVYTKDLVEAAKSQMAGKEA